VLYEWLKRNRCDLVSTHSSTDAWLAALALLGLGRPIPMVRTRHISAPVPRNPPTRWLYTRATARIVTTGEALKEELIRRNGFPSARIDSVPTGVDAKRYRPGDRRAARAALKLPQDAKLVGIVATLRSWKGHRFLIEALPDNAHLAIVGDGPMRQTLEDLVSQKQLRSRVSFVGNQKDVVPWLHALDVFALPSYANEGVPQAVIQAMAVGVPCVTTDAGGIGEIAISDATALVVAKQNAVALAAGIDRLLGDAGLAARLAWSARDRVQAKFGIGVMLDRMETVFRRAADANRYR
jgi:glycosyltransferase involved in cell wall biosynthesis